MKYKFLLFILALICRQAFGQSFPNNPCYGPSQRVALINLQKAVPSEGWRAGQIGLTDTCGNQYYQQYVEVNLTPIAYTPTATGNTSNLSEFVTTPTAEIWYIDWQGNAIRLGGGGSACDEDFLQISDNSCPDALTDSIYKYKYVSIGARGVWPSAELLVNDSTLLGLAVVSGNRNGRLAVHDNANNSFAAFDQGGSTTNIYLEKDGLFQITAVTGTPQNISTYQEHFGVNTLDSTIIFFLYPNTRVDTQTAINFLYTDDQGVVRSKLLSQILGDSVNVYELSIINPLPPQYQRSGSFAVKDLNPGPGPKQRGMWISNGSDWVWLGFVLDTSTVNSTYVEDGSLLYPDLSNSAKDSLAVPVVASVSNLAIYPNTLRCKFVQVSDPDRGGTFTFSTTGTPDGGTVFAGSSGYWVRQREPGICNPKWWGAKGDGSTDDTTPFDQALDKAVSENGVLDIPEGVFIVTSVTDTISGGRLTIRGRGSAVTVLKRKNSTVSSGSPTSRVLRVSGTSGATLTLEGFTVDGNAAGQPVPSPETEFQQCHNIFVQSLANHGFAYVSALDLQSLNPLGDGILFGGDGFGQINVVNFREGLRLYTRSSICTTTTGGWDALNITNFEGPVIEVEPNGFAGSYTYIVNGANWQCNQELDLNLLGARAAGRSGICNLTNVTLKGTLVSLGEFNFNVSNSRFYTDQQLRMAWGSYRFSDCLFYADSAFVDVSLANESSANPTDFAIFQGCDFSKHSSVNLSYYYQDDNAFGSNTESIRFLACRFLNQEQTAGIRSGRFYFNDCLHTYTGSDAAVLYTGNTTKTNVPNEFRASGNVCLNTYLVQPPIAGDTTFFYMGFNDVALGKMVNWTRYDKVSSINIKGAGTGSNNVCLLVTPCVYYQKNTSSTDWNTTTWAPKVGKWIVGDEVIYSNPDSINYTKTVCIRNGNGDGTSATGAPSGAAWAPSGMIVGVTPVNGDLTGFMSAPTVDKVDGIPVQATGATTGNVLTWDGSKWAPAAPSGGGGGIYSPGSGTIASAAISTLSPFGIWRVRSSGFNTLMNFEDATESIQINDGSGASGVSLSNSSTLIFGPQGQFEIGTLSTVYTDFSSGTGIQYSSPALGSSFTSSSLTHVGYFPTRYFAQGGNSFGATGTLGTNDANGVSFETNNNTRVTLDTAGSLNIETATSIPSTPADGVQFYATEEAGKDFLNWKGGDGVIWKFGPDQGFAKVALWSANGNGTGVFVQTLANSESGTATTRNVAATNIFTAGRRLGYVTASTSASVAGTRHNNTQFWAGSGTTSLPGYTFVCRFGLSSSVVTNEQVFVGLRNSAAAITGNTNPSSLTNCIYIGRDAGQTTFRIGRNDGSGTATTIDLGASFPANTTDTDWYEVVFNVISSSVTASTCYYQVTNVSTGATAKGSFNTDLPGNSTMLCPAMWISNGSDTGVIGIDISQYSITTKY